MKNIPLIDIKNIKTNHDCNDGLYDYMRKEIERLIESEEYHRKGYAELYKRIDDAIEYIENEISYGEYSDVYNILKILKGEDE